MPPEPLRVLHFANTTVRAGAEEHILTLLRGLDRARFRLYLGCPTALANLLMRDLPADVELFRVNYFEPYQLGAAWRLARLFRELRIDILHSHMFYSSLCASPVGRLCRVPVIVETPHVREQWRHGWKESFWIDRLVGRSVDAYIAVSHASADYLVREKRLPATKVTYIANGCDLERFDPRHQAPVELKKRLGFSDEDPVLVVLGRLEPQKGHSVLFHALAEVRREFPRVRVVCVGAGSLRVELERLARELGVDQNVRLVGFQSNVQDWLALADFTVLPSLFEGLPLAAIESLAAGRAVVATAVDGTPEVVVDGKTGLTVPPGQSAPLAAAILRLLRHPSLSRQLARTGREWVTQHFSQGHQVRQTERLYLESWEKHGTRAWARRPAPAAAHHPWRTELP